MTTTTDNVLEPFFLRGGAGNLFCIFVGPPPSLPPRRGVLFVPPFGEEMNRARRQVMLQARSLAAAGCGVLIMDIFGTGDSEGDFVEGRWAIWKQDLAVGERWLEAQGLSPVTILALRWGALLAVELTQSSGGGDRHLVLWQPVISGKQHMDQFLRVGVVSAMAGGGGITVREMRQEIEGGRTLEVAGYELHPEVVSETDRRDLSKLRPAAGSRVEWIEIVGTAGGGLGIPAQRILSLWKDDGLDVRGTTIVGEPFWTTVEIAIAPALIEHTTEVITRAS